jgi:hypothetical protein
MRLDAETGAEAKNRSRVLRNVGLEQCDPHGGTAASSTPEEGVQNSGSKGLCDLWSCWR